MSRFHFSLDPDWRFHLGETEEPVNLSHSSVYSAAKAGGASGPAGRRGYDDRSWARVDVPHDYLREAPFSPDAIKNHGYRPLTNGWYRKSFTVPAELVGRHALLVFDGISTAATVYLNGSVVARSFNGYTEIAIDVTDRLYFDKTNTLAVYVRADELLGWWYEGAGIYRHTHLYIKEACHIAHNGIFAKPRRLDATTGAWVVDVEVTLENSAYTAATGEVRVTLLDGATAVGTARRARVRCAPDGRRTVTLSLPVTSPRLWDVEDPQLYTLRTELVRHGEAVDAEDVTVGFRTFSIDPERGFFLNDRPLKIKGTCNHQDHAGVGVAVPDSIQDYRIRRLKEMGTNAYRCSHNPPAREILDACDRYGMIVMDEQRSFETGAENLRLLREQILRDRNHPSVIFYSLFNEEPLQNGAEGAAIFRRLKSLVSRLDDTRLITGAVNASLGAVGAGVHMDVFGQNYSTQRDGAAVRAEHAAFPDMPIIGSENNSAVTTRGCYRTDRDAHVLSNYDEEVVPWGDTVRDGWRFAGYNDFFAGIFIWTGFDYRGEPTPFSWPSCSSQFGVMDTCGFPKDAFYFHKAAFTDEPMMHLFPHWKHEVGETVRVMTVSNCSEVELILNGQSLGRRTNEVCRQNEWQVPFERGTLRAVGYRDGVPVAEAAVQTPSAPCALVLTPDRTVIDNAGQDTVPVRVSVVDKDGIEIPDAQDLVRFEIEGDGFVAGVGNGDPNSHEAEHLPERHLYAGLCQVLVTARRGARSLTLRATAEGLAPAVLTLEVREATPPPSIFYRESNTVDRLLAAVASTDGMPDPRQVYADDDMNTFSPITVDNGWDTVQPHDFTEGWRAFRIPLAPYELPSGKTWQLELASLTCREARFFLDGEPVLTVGACRRTSVTVPLGEVREPVELRAMLRAEEGIGPNGFAVSLSLCVADKR